MSGCARAVSSAAILVVSVFARSLIGFPVVGDVPEAVALMADDRVANLLFEVVAEVPVLVVAVITSETVLTAGGFSSLVSMFVRVCFSCDAVDKSLWVVASSVLVVSRLFWKVAMSTLAEVITLAAVALEMEVSISAFFRSAYD